MRLNRRRFISITAAAGGLPLLGFTPAASESRLRVWSGAALGADAKLQIHHPDPVVAERLIAASLAEVHRLEAILSLYRPDSALNRLNRDGAIEAPPLDLVRTLSEARMYAELTGGAFDVTVQPLWDLYARHFANPDAAPQGPAADAIARAVARIGQEAMEISSSRIRFARPGMSATLNGIGQGYVTDRIVELLRANGIERALVDMGEIRAVGDRPDGRPWSVGLEDPRSPGEIAERIGLTNRALSTSGGYGTVFDPGHRFNHLFEPASGRPSWRFLSVSVEAATATEADALSTAFTLMPRQAAVPIIRARGLTAHFVEPDGSRSIERA
ncbi:MAG: FAD:protein FMN transferase [Ancalomicrobiaceae bacterium]|nr:FAD:protein FMN transferase [Ancalomicrobiaceae bacterium]